MVPPSFHLWQAELREALARNEMLAERLEVVEARDSRHDEQVATWRDAQATSSAKALTLQASGHVTGARDAARGRTRDMEHVTGARDMVHVTGARAPST